MPRIGRGTGSGGSQLILLLIFIIVALYIVSIFVKPVDGTFEFGIPDDSGMGLLTAMKFLVLGAVIYGFYRLMYKTGEAGMSAKDYLTLAVIFVAVWFLWDKFLANFLGADNLNEIGKNAAAKLGFVKP